MMSDPVPPAPLVIHAWYSGTADQQYGHLIYRTRDGQNVVKVTQVSADPNAFYGFADKRYIGLVGTYVSSRCTDMQRRS
jgi:hypothetical protein